jgi:hypothetical protein
MDIRIRSTGAVVSESSFRELVKEAGAAAGKQVTLPEQLTAPLINAYGADVVLAAPQPAVTAFQSVLPAAPTLDAGGNWVQGWTIRNWSQPEKDAYLAQAKTARWEEIKAERDRRKSGGVKVLIADVPYWFHSDDPSRSQYGILDSKAIRAGWADTVVIHSAWKTMSGVKVPMTVARLRQILDNGIVLDAAIFDAAETHRAAMEAAENPATYDFSTGWPEHYQE